MTHRKIKPAEKVVNFLTYLSLIPVLFMICAVAYETIKTGESIGFYFERLLGIKPDALGLPFTLAISSVVILFWIRAFIRSGNN